MGMLEYLCEHELSQSWLAENADIIEDANGILQDLPNVIKEHVMHNLDEFVVAGDLKATFDNIAVFAESSYVSMLEKLSAMINGDQLIDEGEEL